MQFYERYNAGQHSNYAAFASKHWRFCFSSVGIIVVTSLLFSMPFAILLLLASDVILHEYLEKLESDAFSLSAACLSL